MKTQLLSLLLVLGVCHSLPTKNADNGEIKSPNYPNKYPMNTKQRWSVSVERGQVVEVTFVNQFSIDSSPLGTCYDYVQFFDDRTIPDLGEPCAMSNPSPLARICGDELPKSLTSYGNKLVVEFCSDEQTSGVGFDLMWRGTVPPTTTMAPATCGMSDPKYPVEDLQRIVGGTHANAHSWPWAAAMFLNDGGFQYQFCGGSLINENWILTAGHCLYLTALPVDQYRIKLGADNKGGQGTWDPNEPSQQVLEVEKMILHPNYDPDASSHDISLFKLKTPAKINEFVKTGCLPTDSTPVPAGAECAVVGWGTTSSGGDPSEVLLQVEMPIVSNDQCSTDYQPYGYAIDETMICAAIPAGGKDSCQGDSGGPLMLKNDDGSWVIDGVVSWGVGCALPGVPGVYSRVSTMVDWIQKTMEENA